MAQKRKSSRSHTFRFASFGSRLFAFVIDHFILVITYYILSLVIPTNITQTMLAPYGPIFRNTPTFLPIARFQILQMYLTLHLLGILFNYAYAVYFIGSRGQTLGKMIMGIKVIDLKNRQHPTYLQAIVREPIGKFISGLFLGLGFLWMLWDSKKQTWHDKLANTVVIEA